jgi:hypothetical protein
MKKILTFLLLAWYFITNLNAQTYSSAGEYKIESGNKQISVMLQKNSARFSADTAGDFSDYGGKVGFGISILNGFGLPVRYYFNPKNVIEGGVYLGGVVIQKEDLNGDLESIEYKANFMVGVGYSYFGNRFLKEKKSRNKVRAHGIAVRANYLLGDFNTAFTSLGWAMETFKENRRNNSFIFELGLQAAFPDFVYEGVEYSDVIPGIYLRCHWNFFLN